MSGSGIKYLIETDPTKLHRLAEFLHGKGELGGPELWLNITSN